MFSSLLDNHASVKQTVNIKHTRISNLTSLLTGCYLLTLLRPMLPSVGGFAISSDGYFFFREHLSFCVCASFPFGFEMGYGT